MSHECYMPKEGIIYLSDDEFLWVLENQTKFHKSGGGGITYLNPNPQSLTGTDKGLHKAEEVLRRDGRFKPGDLSSSKTETAKQTPPSELENE